MFRASKSFRGFAISGSFGHEVTGVVGGDEDEVGRCRFEEDAEAELRRNEDEGEGKWS